MCETRRPPTWRWVVLTFLVCAACNDNVSSFYASYEDLKRSGAIERGWIPSWLPPGIHHIYELDNLDSGQTWCRFDFTDADAIVLRNQLKAVTGEWPYPIRDPGVEWWPTAMRGRLDPATLRREGLELYRQESLLFAVNWQNKRAFLYAHSS